MEGLFVAGNLGYYAVLPIKVVTTSETIALVHNNYPHF
jgi:hypothetical protein